MSSMTFQINDSSTDGIKVAVWVTITENADGTLAFNVTQEGGIVGDLRGLFFDMANESILKSLVVTAASTDIRIGDDSIKDLGDGSNMNGLLGTDKGYDIGIEIGTSGIGKDDVRSYSFTLDSPVRDLSLSDFANVDFAARLTSVGTIGGSRADSAKILENTSAAISLVDEAATVLENNLSGGNLLDGLGLSGATTVTGWSGGAVNEQIALSSEGDIIGALRVNSDGSYLLDASAADKLSAGEEIVFNLNYSARNQDEATSWSTDNAALTVKVVGTNDGPVADDDYASTTENDVAATGTVLGNDSDIDRLDTLSVSAISATAITNGAGATFALNANGRYVLDASAADTLSEGETIEQEFTYTLSDNHGATDTATISVKVTGTNDGPVANDDDGGRVTEDAVLSGSVTANDSDVDRLDTHTWSLTSFDGKGNLSFNEDGTWSYDANGAYDYLNDGQSVELSFQYQMADNHGASDLGTVLFTVDGIGGVEPPLPPVTDSYPEFQKDISHVVLAFDTTNGDNNGDGYYTVKIDNWEGGNDLDAEIDSILAYLIQNDANIDAGTELLGAQIKGGSVGKADGSYDDFWANDGSPDTTIVEWDSISQRETTIITEVASTDAAPYGLDVGQNSQTNVDETYTYLLF